MLTKPILYQSKAYVGTMTTTLPAMVIQYIGSGASGLVAVDAATGDIAFTHGALSSEAADTTLGLPTANGTIDVSDASANTFAKVLANINSSANWRAYLVGVKGSDLSTNTLTTISATQAKVAAGLALGHDEAVGYLAGGMCLSRQAYTSVNAGTKLGDVLNTGYLWQLNYFTITTTYASGTSVIKVWEINDTDGTETLRFSIGGAATTAPKVVKFGLDYNMPISCVSPGNRLLVEVNNSAAKVYTAVGTGTNTDGQIIAGQAIYYGI